MKSIVAQELERLGALSEPFEVTFADGETYRNRPGRHPRSALRFHNRAVEWGIAAFGHIGMCDAYFDGDLDIEGDLRAAFRAGMSSGYGSANRVGRPAQSMARASSFQCEPCTGQGKRARALRTGRRVLSALARRPADDVHLRVLARRGQPASRRRRSTRSSTSAASCSCAQASPSSTSDADSAASCSTQRLAMASRHGHQHHDRAGRSP